MFIDSHAHIDGPEFDADREEVLQRAQDAGVQFILNVGTGDPHSGALERAVEFGRAHRTFTPPSAYIRTTHAFTTTALKRRSELWSRMNA